MTCCALAVVSSAELCLQVEKEVLAPGMLAAVAAAVKEGVAQGVLLAMAQTREASGPRRTKRGKIEWWDDDRVKDISWVEPLSGTFLDCKKPDGHLNDARIDGLVRIMLLLVALRCSRVTAVRRHSRTN